MRYSWRGTMRALLLLSLAAFGLGLGGISQAADVDPLQPDKPDKKGAVP